MSEIPNKNYAKGRRAEYKAKAELEKLGYKVFRSAGSHTKADLISFKGDEVRFIQIKTTKTKNINSANMPNHYLKDLNALRTMVCYFGQPNYTAELWVKSKNKGWAIRKYRYANGC